MGCSMDSLLHRLVSMVDSSWGINSLDWMVLNSKRYYLVGRGGLSSGEKRHYKRYVTLGVSSHSLARRDFEQTVVIPMDRGVDELYPVVASNRSPDQSSEVGWTVIEVSS